jgi:hypothetical protein
MKAAKNRVQSIIYLFIKRKILKTKLQNAKKQEKRKLMESRKFTPLPK